MNDIMDAINSDLFMSFPPRSQNDLARLPEEQADALVPKQNWTLGESSSLEIPTIAGTVELLNTW
jgi:hypothetical protein